MLTAEQVMDDRPGARMATASRSPEPVDHLCRYLIDRRFRDDAEYRRYGNGHARRTGQVDFLFASPQRPHAPQQVFEQLRWGGLFVFASLNAAEVADLAAQFVRHGFALESEATFLRRNWLDLPIPLPWLSKKIHYFIARKVLLIPPGSDTDRFTYQVSLTRRPDPAEPWVVLKQVPSLDSVVARLSSRFTNVEPDVIEKRARKFVDKIFPTFLTREAALLRILEKHLPEPYCRRVPRLTGIEKDERGFVRRLTMNWLRVGGPTLSQMDFAHQSADLLRAVHDVAAVIHLDLRLDNFVITENGVGFVDFGSAVRVNENLRENPLLAALFDELMRTSQIQRMLEEMTISGEVTSHIISRGYQRADKAVDFFYLAVQFNFPHASPELAPLIDYDPESEEAQRLDRLTDQILRPPDPANPIYRSAHDIVRGIERLGRA